MSEYKKAFKEPIKDGKARILLTVQKIECEVENNAPDFVSVDKDEVKLGIEFPGDTNIDISEIGKLFELGIKKFDEEENLAVISPEFQGVWFDIDIDKVKDVWVADLSFSIVSKNARYLAYYIKTLDHQFEWLQPDMVSGEIKSMSVSKKKYKAPKISGKETFSSSEVIRVADMLNRAIKKIDLRTGGAYVKFNMDKGRLEPLVIGIADKLGYDIEPLPKEEIISLESSGMNASHSIYLKGIR
jgi:hypothetical protein